MMKHLPHDSLFKSAVGGLDQSWSQETHFLAGLIDAVNANTYATIRVQGGKMAAPKPIPRPGEKSKGQNLFASMARAAYNKAAA